MNIFDNFENLLTPHIFGVRLWLKRTSDTKNMETKKRAFIRVAPDTDLAGYPTAGYSANIFAGYPAE